MLRLYSFSRSLFHLYAVNLFIAAGLYFCYRAFLSHLQEQLSESESRLEAFRETATSVAQPLLRQIETLQARIADQAKSSESTEHELRQQIGKSPVFFETHSGASESPMVQALLAW